MFLLEWRIVPIYWQPVANPALYWLDKATIEMETDKDNCNNVQRISKCESRHTKSRPVPVRPSQKCITMAFIEFPALLTTTTAALVPLNPHLNMAKNWTALTAKGLKKIVSNKSFYGLIRNLSVQSMPIPNEFMSNVFSNAWNQHVLQIFQHPQKSLKWEMQKSNQNQWLEYRQLQAHQLCQYNLQAWNWLEHANSATKENRIHKYRANKVQLDWKKQVKQKLWSSNGSVPVHVIRISRRVWRPLRPSQRYEIYIWAQFARRWGLYSWPPTEVSSKLSYFT